MNWTHIWNNLYISAKMLVRFSDFFFSVNYLIKDAWIQRDTKLNLKPLLILFIRQHLSSELALICESSTKIIFIAAQAVLNSETSHL